MSATDRDADSFDYIVVGAGSAGCVLAARLSADPRKRVLLIEAGPTDDDPFVAMPVGLFRLFRDPRRTWNYALEPDPCSGRRHAWIRGRMLGGSSSMNGMLYCRGQPQDYDGWEALGCRGWGWAEMSRVFRAIEDHELGDDGVRGVGGPLHVTVPKERTPLTEAIIAAGAGLGLPVHDDLNRPGQEGIGYHPRTIWHGRRVSAADAFLKPARGRPNLVVVTDTMVEKLEFEGRRAVRIACRQGSQPRTYAARREIILAAGALQSPVLLQLSGVGPAELLRGHGIEVVADRPDVGRNAREHKAITLLARVTGHSLNREFHGWRKLRNGLRYYATRSGPLASTYDVGAFVRTEPGLDRPNAQLIFWSVTPERHAPLHTPEREPGLQVMCYPLRSDSRGVVQVRSRDPREPPSIDMTFLATDDDRRTLVDLVRYVRRLLGQAPLQPFIVDELNPGRALQTDEQIVAACHQHGTCMHTVGTCRMGGDAGSVVDPQLRVRGVEGLRVVDCSVMPTEVSGNTAGPVMALAWRAAEIIAAESG